MKRARMVAWLAALGLALQFCAIDRVIADEKLYLAAKREGSVNWYGVWPKDLMDRISSAFEAAHPGVTVNVFRSGSSKVAAKVEVELQSGKVLSDIMTVSEELIMNAFKRKGYLEPFKTVHFEKFRPEYRDAGGYWLTPRVATVGLWYNVEKLKNLGLPVPTSWADLASPVYRGEVVLGSPLYSGVFSSFVGALSQKEGFGWPYFRKVAANGPLYVADVPDVARAIAAGQKTLGPVVLGYISMHPLHPNGSVAIVTPKEGVLVIQSSSTLIKNRPHPEAARLLQTFLASSQAASIIRDAKYLSGRMDVEPPEGIPAPQPAIFPDPDWLEKNGEQLRKSWSDVTAQR